MTQKVKSIYFVDKRSNEKTKYTTIQKAEKELRSKGIKISATQISKILNNKVKIEYPYTFIFANDDISRIIELESSVIYGEEIYSINNTKEIFKRFGTNNYLVGTCGNIYNLDYSRFLFPQDNSTDRLIVRLNNLAGFPHGKRIAKLVNRLVAQVFVPIPDKYKDLPIDKLIVHHIDENYRNNYVENLEWLTIKEHKQKHEKNGFHQKSHLYIQELLGKKIARYDINGKYISSYKSIRDALKKMDKNPNSKNAIIIALDRPNKTAFESYWKTIKIGEPPSEFINVFYSKDKGKMPIIAISTNNSGNIKFTSITACTKKSHIDFNKLKNLLKTGEEYKGFTFKYI